MGVRQFCNPRTPLTLKGARALRFSLKGVRGRAWAKINYIQNCRTPYGIVSSLNFRFY
jgi:hypothetical protein